MGLFWQGQPPSHRAEQVEANYPAVCPSQPVSRPHTWGNGRAAGLAVKWTRFCDSSTNCGPSVPTGLYHYEELRQTLPLSFAKQPQDMAADAITLSFRTGVSHLRTNTRRHEV